MAVIETKYSVGDVVYHAGITTERKKHPCPDCKDTRQWKAVSPAGEEYTFGCPRCSASYQSYSDLSLDYAAHVPNVQRLTIGSVQFNSASGLWDSGARYMCAQTGVGSGTVYDEAKLFSTEEDAISAATAASRIADKSMEWVAKLYDKTLDISDYQLSNAALKVADETSSRARSLLWNINNLFATIAEADDKDAIIEAVDDYKSYTWERDKQKLTDATVAA